MRATPPTAWRSLAVLLLVLGPPGGWAVAQGIAPGRGATGPGASPTVPPRYAGAPAPISPGVRRVQAEMPPQPAPSIPGEPSPTSETDLTLPSSERESGGGAPTEIAAQQEEPAAAEEEEEDEEPTPLMKALGLEDSPVKIYGWIQNSFTANPSRPADRNNFGVTPNSRSNDWRGHQYYTVLEKPLEQEDRLNFGFRVDSLFGHDWQFNKMYGLFDEAFNPGQFTGYDLAQFYGEAHLPILTEGGLDVKFGRWYTLHGYEVVPAIGRPLLSVPYMFTFGQPFTHIGAMTTLHVNDQFTIYNGTTNGWDRFFNENYNWGYMGGFAWTSKDTKTNLTLIYSFGPNQFPRDIPPDTTVIPTGTGPGNIGFGVNPGYSSNYRTLFTTVVSHKWTDKLTQVVETDEAFEENIPGLAGDGGPNQNAEWYSLGNWFLYSFNDKLTGVWRSEVFRDDDGIRTGFADTFYEQTLGLIYKPHNWLWIRPEARYDWSQFSRPYNAGVSKSQFTFGFDIILLY